MAYNQQLLDSLEPSLLQKLGYNILKPVAGLGRILDTPGSVVRGILAEDYDRAFGGILDASKRVSGSELVGNAPDEFSLSGLGAEILTDPVNALSFGTLSSAGKLAKTAGKLGRTAKTAETLGEGLKPLKVSDNLITQLEILDRLKTDSVSKLNKVLDKQEALGRVRGEELGFSLADQAKAGHRNLVSINPLGLFEDIPLIRGTSVFKGLDKTGELLRKIPLLDKLTTPLQSHVSNSNEALAQEIHQQSYNLTQAVPIQAKILEKDLQDRITKLAKLSGVKEQDLLQQLNLATELKPGDPKLATIPQAILDAAPSFKKLYADLLAFEDTAGVHVSKLESQGLDYIHHALTPAGQEFFKNNKKAFEDYVLSLKIPTQGFQKERNFVDISVDELNARFKEKFGNTEDFFSNNIPALIARRYAQGQLAAIKASYVQGLAKLVGTNIDTGQKVAPLLGRLPGQHLVSTTKLRNIPLDRLNPSYKLPLVVNALEKLGLSLKHGTELVKQKYIPGAGIAKNPHIHEGFINSGNLESLQKGIKVPVTLNSDLRREIGEAGFNTTKGLQPVTLVGKILDTSTPRGRRAYDLLTSQTADKLVKQGISVDIPEFSELVNTSIQEQLKSRGYVAFKDARGLNVLDPRAVRIGTAEELRNAIPKDLREELQNLLKAKVKYPKQSLIDQNLDLKQGPHPAVINLLGARFRDIDKQIMSLLFNVEDTIVTKDVAYNIEQLVAEKERIIAELNRQVRRGPDNFERAYSNEELARHLGYSEEEFARRASLPMGHPEGFDEEEISQILYSINMGRRYYRHNGGEYMVEYGPKLPGSNEPVIFRIIYHHPNGLPNDWKTVGPKFIADLKEQGFSVPENIKDKNALEDYKFELADKYSSKYDSLSYEDVINAIENYDGQIFKNVSITPEEKLRLKQLEEGGTNPGIPIIDPRNPNPGYTTTPTPEERLNSAIKGEDISSHVVELPVLNTQFKQAIKEYYNSGEKVLPSNQSRVGHLRQGLSPKTILPTSLDIPTVRRNKDGKIIGQMSNSQIDRELKKSGFNRYIDGKIYDDAVTMMKMAQDPEVMKGFLKVVDTVNSVYRGLLTGYFPAFHSRNIISGIFMGTLAGIANPKYYTDAVAELRRINPKELQYLTSLGVLNKGHYSETLQMLMNANINPTNKFFVPAQKVGQFIDNSIRLGHFRAMQAKGLSDTEAAASVVKYLFDYNDVTDLEKKVLRRSMLFYTFMRKNLPLMMESWVTHPHFMTTYARATGQTNSNIQQPSWLPDSFFFGKDEQGNVLRGNFGLPPEDLARFNTNGKGLHRLLELIISQMTPIVKTPYEVASQRDSSIGRPLEGGIIRNTLDTLPTSRLTGTLARMIDNPEKTSFRALTGVTIREVPKNQKQLNEIDLLRSKLQGLVRSGEARNFPIVVDRYGKKNERLRELNSKLQKLQSQRKKD